ncbi:hypothetical protein [Lacticaseibacillus pantheris]|nr:hypothetical protein [Lacticaseibacillus pantheris]WKF85029.1 hypothetical protein QY874_00010 [Lacticaseibacillus pantheris]
MQYRLQLDTKTQEFIAIDRHDSHRVGRGQTVEQAIAAMKR